MSGHIEKVWRSRENILTILEKRGYNIRETDRMTLDQFSRLVEDTGVAENKEMTFFCTKDDGDRIKVYWPVEPKLGGSEYRVINSDMEAENLKKAIIVTKDGLTSHAETTLRYANSQKLKIDTFRTEELQANIFDHVKVPEHIICGKKEKKNIMKTYNLSSSQIPKIKETDPVIKRLGAVRGDLIKITDESVTMPGYTTVYYRIVA